MNFAYLFTFFLVLLIVLFLFLPFVRGDKSTSDASAPEPAIDESLPEEIALDLGRSDVGSDVAIPQTVQTEYEMEIEVAVKRVRLQKSTFTQCPQCGHRMQQADRFCASCGHARQSS